MTDETQAPGDDPYAPYLAWCAFMDKATDQRCPEDATQCECPSCMLFFWWYLMDETAKGKLFAEMARVQQ